MTVSAGLNSVSVYRTVPVEDGVAREDIVGMRVYASTTQNFVADATTLKYSGSSLSYTITGLLGGVTYYVKTALISSFLGDSFTEDDLVISDEGAVTTQKAPGSLNVIISTPAVVLSASNTGVVSSYAGSGTTIRVYDGATEVVYDGVGTANGTWKVVPSSTNLTIGSITDSGTFATVGNHSNLTADSTTVTYEITGKTALGSSFSLSATQTLSKAKSGSTGSQGTRGWTIARISGDWNQISAESAISSVVVANGSSPTTPIAGDTVFYTGGAKQYNGSEWVEAEKFIDGSLIVNGTVVGEHLASQFNIQAGGKIIAGDEQNGVVISSDKTVKVKSNGSTAAVLGEIEGQYGFRAYSPDGNLLFDSLADTAILADFNKSNFVLGNTYTFPDYNSSLVGRFNLAIGDGALSSGYGLSTNFNVAIGSGALAKSSGGGNAAVGVGALAGGVSGIANSGSNNCGIGFESFYKLLSGDYNIAVGCKSNFGIEHVSSSIAVGALSNAGNNSTIIGSYAGASTSECSVAVGSTSTAGSYSVVSGYSAGNSDSTYSVAVGSYSGMGTGDYNVSVGYQTLYTGAGSKSTALGYQAAAYATSNNLVAVGYQSAMNATGLSVTALGYSSLALLTAGNNNTALGYLAGGDIDNVSGNTLVGSSAGRLSTSNNCSSLGVASGYHATFSDHLISVGYYAGEQAASCSYAIMVGTYAGRNSTAANSTLIGYSAGRYNAAPGSIAIGYSAYAASTSVNPSSVVGFQSCAVSTSSEHVTALGYQTFRNLTTGSYGTAIGHQSGYRVTTGSHNTFLGNLSGMYVTTGSNNLFLGSLSGSAGSDVSNCIILGGYATPESNTILISTGDGASLRAKCTSSGEWDFKGKLGYKTTTSVTQVTSRSTGVTLNGLTGKITLASESVVAGAVTSFTVTNSSVSATDLVTIHQISGTSPLFVSCTGVSAGSFRVSITSPVSIAAATADLRFIVIMGG